MYLIFSIGCRVEIYKIFNFNTGDARKETRKNKKEYYHILCEPVDPNDERFKKSKK